ncbi:MAG: hypothetical protein QOF72_1119 [Blastocatellia bacterium]|jgi:hypothetical protein|nr:hypothetical protein [Blastocatellia bacterium]
MISLIENSKPENGNTIPVTGFVFASSQRIMETLP